MAATNRAKSNKRAEVIGEGFDGKSIDEIHKKGGINARVVEGMDVKEEDVGEEGRRGNEGVDEGMEGER